MKAFFKAIVLVLVVLSCLFIYWIIIKTDMAYHSLNPFSQTNRKEKIDCTTGSPLKTTRHTTGSPLKTTHRKQQYTPKEPGIIFVETSDRMLLPSLVPCSIESAARTYPDRPVYFFMKGLPDDPSMSLMSHYHAIFLLAAMKNVHILPLRFEELFQDTPLHHWYQTVDPLMQRFWIHHVSDACRLALTWKYGGIYMDTDVISFKPIPYEDFLAAETDTLCSSAVLGFRRHHLFLWDCMEDYVKNYNGDDWLQQGPGLYTRMAKKICQMPNFTQDGDGMCSSFSFLHPKRFFPITFRDWVTFFEAWDINSNSFDSSYALHFWNYMNKEQRTVTAGSNTLAEHLYKQYCPLTYERFVKN